MKRNWIMILSILGAALLIGSFPLKAIAGSEVSDFCRLGGFVLVFVVLGLRGFRKDKPEKPEEATN